ncbi:MAG: NUDIX domain-containing protein [Chloroflexia bacterium]|nr:NUDIX domain-containing protein [Chloroflexia bacterium]MDQ3513837.1 NUDIX domain-containing protein [Chloroflexota bacterium]
MPNGEDEPVPTVVANSVDAYLVRRQPGGLQFLLLLRKPDLPLGQTWQPIHTQVTGRETAMDAAKRAIRTRTGIHQGTYSSADIIHQFYDHLSDTVVLAPVLVCEVGPRVPVVLDDEHFDSAWCDREEATARLLWAGQRSAVRHIDDLLGPGGPDTDFYRIS